MILRKFTSDERAVSPVIGVILMVAITVILAAVIGTFVLGLGQKVGQTSPTASISIDQAVGNDADVRISHESGAALKSSNIEFVLEDNGDGDSLSGNPTPWAAQTNPTGEITAGESITIQVDGGSSSGYESGDTVKVIWSSDDGKTSSVLKEYEIE